MMWTVRRLMQRIEEMKLRQPVPLFLISMSCLYAGIGADVQAQTVRFSPSVETRLTWTDNSRATSSGQQTDWITEVTPGFNLSRDSGRIHGRLYTRWRQVAYANESDRNTSYLSLQGTGQIEAVERFLFVDLDSSISRSNQSAFSGRQANDTLNTDRNNETRMFSVAPRAHFNLWGDAAGVAGYRSRTIDNKGPTGRQNLEQWNLDLNSPGAFGRMGWMFGHNYSKNTYQARTQNDVVRETTRGTLLFSVSPQFRLKAIAGYESNDYGASQKDRGTIYGGGFDWSLSERTTFAGTSEKRQFGHGYTLDFNHRMPRSNWSLTARQDISSSGETQGSDVYQDPLFLLYFNSPLLVSQYPDPVEREQFVRQLLGYPAAGSGNQIVTNAYYVNRSIRGGGALVGARSVVSFSLQQDDRTRENTLSGLVPGDDFANLDTIKTSTGVVALNYRLTPLSSLDASLSGSRAEGKGRVNQNTTRTGVSLGFSSRLGPKTFAGVVYRHQRAMGDESANDYRENAVVANLGLRF